MTRQAVSDRQQNVQYAPGMTAHGFPWVCSPRKSVEIRCSEKDTLVNSQVPEITIYSFMYLCTPFQRCGVNSLREHSALGFYEQARIAATRLVRTAVILSSSETSGPD